MWRTGLVALQHLGSSWTRARTRVPCIGRRILNHCTTREVLFFFFNIYLFIWLCQILAAACGLLSCGMRILSCGMHVGSSSLTRYRTRAPCIGSVVSYPLCHQGSHQQLLLYSLCRCLIPSWGLALPSRLKFFPGGIPWQSSG